MPVSGKERAARAAMAYIADGMILGLGTGSTARYFIQALGEKVASGWRVRGVPTSAETARLGVAAGIEIITPDEATHIDVAVDGTDEADGALSLIKGGGGALLREKIVARAARRFVVIADATKRVETLGAFPLPIEVEPFAVALTIRLLRETLGKLGYGEHVVKMRMGEGSTPFISDGGHYIVDCGLGTIADPPRLDAMLSALPGVIETGLFCGLANLALFGDGDSVDTVSAP